MGVLITHGSRVIIPEGGLTLTVGPNGDPVAECTLHISYDMYPTWLRIALEHAAECLRASEIVDAVWSHGSTAHEIDALEMELRAGMQTSVAAAAAVDGFYGTVQALSHTRDQHRPDAKRPARYARIAEALKRSFKIGPQSFSEMRGHLETLFRFRDEAVHPIGHSREPAPHPRLPVSAERRLVMYTAENAKKASGLALSTIGQLLLRPKDQETVQLREHCKIAQASVMPLVEQWEATHNTTLFPRAPESPS